MTRILWFALPFHLCLVLISSYAQVSLVALLVSVSLNRP